MNAGTKENGTKQATASDRFCANGEAPARKSEVIPCQATEDFGSVEGVETRGPSSNGNVPHECPAPQLEGEEIVRHSVETRRASLNSSCGFGRSKSPVKGACYNSCIYGALKMYTPAKNMILTNVGRAAGSIA